MLGLDIAYMRAKFDHSSFSRSRDMVGAHSNLNGLCDLTLPLSDIVCHSWAITCYDQHVIKFKVSIYTHKIVKMGRFGVIRSH